MKCICFTFPILSSPDNQWKISDIRFKFMNSKQKQRQAVLHLKKSIQEREQPCQSFAPDQISSSFCWQGFHCFLPKVGWICCSPYVQLQGAGAILGGNCGNCRSQVSPGAPSNPSQLYSPAPSSNKSSVTKAAPFWTFVCWQPAMTVFGSWQKPLRSRDAGTSAVSSQFGFNLTDLMTASDESLTSVK